MRKVIETTACGKLYELLDRLLIEKKSLDEIGNELCDSVMIPRLKAIRLIKSHKGEQYLKDNADWLGYVLSNNPEGIKTTSEKCYESINKNVEEPKEKLPEWEDIPCGFVPKKPLTEHEKKCPVCGRGIYNTIKDIWREIKYD